MSYLRAFRHVFIATSIAGTTILFLSLGFDLRPSWITRPAAAQIAPIGVYTERYDNTRMGVNSNEVILSPANVSTSTFGKLFTQAVDGEVYAQPLYVPSVNIPNQGVHNVVYVASEHDSVYAFDADTSGPPLAQVSLIGAGETTVPAGDVKCNEITNEIGITSTPVIDPATNTIYVLARTKVPSSPPQYVQRLHALDITTLNEQPNFPVVISASVPGSGKGNVGGVINFDPLHEQQRAALLLSENGPTGKQVYVAWASSCDAASYHGWVLSYDPVSGALDGIFNTTPNGLEGGIWQSGSGLAEDATGYIFAAVSNGDFNPAVGDYGDSIIKLAPAAPPSTSLTVADFFTPSYECAQLDQDLDMGSGGPFLLTDQSFSPADLLITGDKLGTLYILNSDNLGGGPTPSPCPSGIPTPTAAPPECADSGTIPECFFDATPTPGLLYGTASYWNYKLYVAPAKKLPEAFLRSNGIFGTSPVDQVPTGKFSIDGPRGVATTISANGAAGGILWILDDAKYNVSSPILYAYDATNLHSLLWASSMNSARDDPGGITVKFANPIVANGKVYVGTQSTLAVYGLLSQPTPTITASMSPSPSPSNTATPSPTATASPVTTFNFSLASISFGKLPIGDTSVVKSEGVKNAGAAAGNFSSVNITGPNSTDFNITSNTCVGTLNAGSTCSVKLDFRATATSGTTETASLAFADNATGNPQSIPLSGSAINGLTTNVKTLGFGTVTVGVTSSPMSLSIKNNHAYPVSLSQAFGGAAAGDYQLTPATTCTSSLSASSQCTDSITFTPAATGARDATLTINDSIDPAVVVSLNGTGG